MIILLAIRLITQDHVRRSVRNTMYSCDASSLPQPPTHDPWRTRWQSGSANMSHHQPLPTSNIRRQPVRVRLPATAALRPAPLTSLPSHPAHNLAQTISQVHVAGLWTPPRAHDALAKAAPGASSRARRACSCAPENSRRVVLLRLSPMDELGLNALSRSIS